MKIYFLFIILLASSKFFAQNNMGKADDVARISISTYVSDRVGNLTEEAKNLLVTKLSEITTNNGTGGSKSSSRFIITPQVTELTKDITPSDPVIYQYELGITLFIGDGVAGTKFSSFTINVKGNGHTETKAYLAALKQIKPSDVRFKKFIDEGKQKIIEYYNSQCDFILKDAQALAGMKNYDQSIFTLASVPEVCKECYEKCLDKITEVYKAKVENECQQNIAQAKTLIAQDNYNDAASMLSAVTPDMQCYAQAASVIKDINDHKCAVSLGEAKGYWVSHDVSSTSMALSSIPSDSKCYAEAMVLAKEVEKYVKETEKRDYEVMKQSMKNEQASKMATIKAARDIGVAYGNNQPKTITKTTYNISGWW